MPKPNEPDNGTPGTEDPPPLGCCPICNRPAGECDHLVAAIDRTFAEITSGALFVHTEEVIGMMHQLIAVGPEILRSIGSGPALQHVASIVTGDMEEGTSLGDALAANSLPIIAALSYMLQEDDEVLISEGEEGPGGAPSFENLWAEAPERVVDRLAVRLGDLLYQLEA
jgi:hypothetical protein